MGVDYFRTNNEGPTTQSLKAASRRRASTSPRPTPPSSPKARSGDPRASPRPWTHTPGAICSACRPPYLGDDLAQRVADGQMSPGAAARLSATPTDGKPCAACLERATPQANFVPHDTAARSTGQYPSMPSTVGPGEYLGVPKFGADIGDKLKRAAPRPFDSSSGRVSTFDTINRTPASTDYNPEAADPLLMSVANAKSISLPGTEQYVDMDRFYYDKTQIGPGTYEQPEETAQRTPSGNGYKSNFVGGTGRQAIDAAELAVRNGMPFEVQHPDAKPTPGPTDYDADHSVKHRSLEMHDMSHKSHPSMSLDHLQYDHTQLGPGTYEPSHKLTEPRAATMSLSTREELHSDGRITHWLPRDKLAAQRGPTDYEPPRSDFDIAAAAPGDTDIPNDGAAGNTCKAAFSTQESMSLRPENTVPGGLRYDSAMGAGWRPAVPWTVGPGSYPPYDPEAEAMEADALSRGFGANEKNTVPFNFTETPPKFFEKWVSVGAKPVPGPGSYDPTDHSTIGHGHRKPRDVPPTVQTSPAHSFPKGSGPEARSSSKHVDMLTGQQVAVPSARSVSSGLTSLVQAHNKHAASAGGAAHGINMEHLYRDESLVEPGSYQPDWGPNAAPVDTGADRGPANLRGVRQANFAESVEGCYSKASVSGFMSDTAGVSTGSLAFSHALRSRRATPRWGDWDVQVGGPWQWHDDEGAKRARAREPRVPGPGTYDDKQYEALRPRVCDALILPEKGQGPAYSTAKTASTSTITQHASHRLSTHRQMMAAQRQHIRHKSGRALTERTVFQPPTCAPGVAEPMRNRHRMRTPTPEPPPRVATPEEELDTQERLERREAAAFKRMEKGNYADAATAAKEALEKMDAEIMRGELDFNPKKSDGELLPEEARYSPATMFRMGMEDGEEPATVALDTSGGDVLAKEVDAGAPEPEPAPAPAPVPSRASSEQPAPVVDERSAGSGAASPRSYSGPSPTFSSYSKNETSEDRTVRLYLVMLQAAYGQHQHDEVYRLLAEAEDKYPGNSRLASFSDSFQAAILVVISPPVSEVSEEMSDESGQRPPRKPRRPSHLNDGEPLRLTDGNSKPKKAPGTPRGKAAGPPGGRRKSGRRGRM